MAEPRDDGRDAARAASDFLRFPAGKDLELLYFPATRTALTVSSQTAALLQRCQGFATLDEHARQAARAFRLAPERAATLVRQLEQLARAGVLVSRAEWAARVPAARRREPTPPPVSTLGIPTRNRPQALSQALSSYAANARAFGRTLEYVVCDDSDTPQARAANRAALHELARREGVRLRYADADSRRRYTGELARAAGLPEELLAFALENPEGYPVAHGAARNGLLLDALDQVCVQVDDDTLCHLAPVPGALAGLALSSRDDPTEFHFFEDHASALAAVEFTPRDFLGLHERLLGRGLGACCAEAAGQLEPSQPDAELERDLFTGSGSVVATSLGIVGDSGMTTPLPYLLLGGASRQRLWAAPDNYRRLLASRQVLRGARRATLTNGTFCMSTNLGLDQRGLLPPFFPVQRNEDGAFAAVLRNCFRGAYRGLQPWVVLHAPAPERRFDLEDVWRVSARLPLGDLIAILVDGFGSRPRGSDPAANLGALGRHLADVASLPAADFEEFLRVLVWRWTSSRLGRLERELRESPDAPADWSDDLRRQVEAWRRVLPTREGAVPHDLPARGDIDQAHARLRRLLGRYGELLQCWPTVRAAARRLRERDVRPAAASIEPA